jgi:hypothetical protein
VNSVCHSTAIQTDDWTHIIFVTQPTRGGPPAWVLGEGLTTPYRKIKKKLIMKCHTGPRNWWWFLWTRSTGWTIGVLGFYSWRRLGIFLFTTASRTALGPTHPPIQWIPGAPSLGVKRQGIEADHSPPPSAEVKNAWSYTSTPPIRLHGVVLS